MGNISGVRLLIVDDEPDMEPIIRHAFRRHTKVLGWQLAFAQDGAEALQKVREQGDFDVMVTDINMPVMDGLTLLDELQAMDLDMKAVVISAYGDMLSLRSAMQRGALDFVTKPINLSDLEATVDKTLAVVMRLKQARRAEIRKAQAEAASLAKSRFLADVSHELRTPLNAIILFSELLIDELGDRQIHDLMADARKIRWAGRHLMTLISDLLDLSQLDAGRLTLRPETFQVPELACEVADLMRETMSERGNRLELLGVDGFGPMRADATRLRQCLLNLLGNASKFTEHGTVRLTLERDANDVLFVVSDSGIGMTEEQAARVFERFEQADPSIGHIYGGTGLGLAITAQLCSLMGGSIHVQSTPGVGSTFTMRLPSGLGTPVPLPAVPEPFRGPGSGAARTSETSEADRVLEA